jgi:porin
MKRKYFQKTIIVAGVALSILAQTPAANAEEQPPPAKSGFLRFCEQDYLLGDWGGTRTKLKDKGVNFEFFYAASAPDSLGGGIEHGAIYQGALLMALDLDSEKLVGYEGGTLHVGSLWLNGQKPFSDRYVGDLNKVNLVDFSNGLRLWELWYEQKFLGDRLSLKFGQLSIDRDFIVPEYYNSLASLSLLNQTFFYPTMAFNVYDQPGFPVGNHALASTPYGAPGVRLRIDPCQYAYFQFGAYDGNPDRTHNGTHINLGGDQGALLYSELTLKLNQSKDAQGPPGNIKIGGYYHTDDFFDMYQGTFWAFDNILAGLGAPPFGVFPNPATHKGNYGLYFLADQMLWREIGKDDPAQQGLAGFFRLGYAPPDRNLAQFGADGGLVYKGLIPTRDWDTLAIGASYLEISDDLKRAQRDINKVVPGAFTKIADYEAVLELSYKAQMTAWWTVQPSLQRVFHPGGRVSANIPDAWVFIVQTTLRF